MVRPTIGRPDWWRMAATVELSTPPLMATTVVSGVATRAGWVASLRATAHAPAAGASGAGVNAGAATIFGVEIVALIGLIGRRPLWSGAAAAAGFARGRGRAGVGLRGEFRGGGNKF